MQTLARIICALVLIALPSAAGAADKGLTVKGIRYFSYSGFTRIVFETEEAAPYVLTRSGDGKSLYFSSYGGPFVLKVQQLPVINDGAVKGMERHQEGDVRSLIIPLGPAAGDVKDFVLRGPDRIVVDVLRGTAPAPEAARKAPVVVLDAGHGGADTGIVSAQGVEKAFTLELANAVRRLLKRSATKMTVLLTRERDQHMTLDERAAFANASGAMLFVSLHAAEGSGSRVFILDPDEGQSIASAAGHTDFQGFDAVSEQQQMLWGTQQAKHSQESGRLGRGMARLFSGSDASEPEQAPLAQLKTVDAAAVLVESGTAGGRTEAAEAIAQGIERYVREKR
jgi:N-acetylmuramoyl-L-alanine amidase